MDSPNRTVSDIVGLVKSWMPWRSEPAHVSRDFWMPDESCMVCYECDSQFTVFNRRHHCRLCGRVFCSKCTSNWIPTSSSEPKTPPEDWDKIRACNYCFKLWEQGLTAPVENGNQAADLDLTSSSPSANSFISTKSSFISSMTFVSHPQTGFTPYQSSIAGASTDRQSIVATMNNDHDMGIGEQNLSQDQLRFFPCRSDDEDDEFGASHLSSRTSNFSQSQANGYFGNVQFDDINSDYNSCNAHPDGDTVDSRSTKNYPLQSSFDSQASKEDQQVFGKAVENYISDECEAPSSLFVAEDVDLEPVDFENNGVLWLPPEPEDEEDEKEALLFEDDDDDDDAAAGEWGYSSNSSSVHSGEHRSRDKSNDDQKQVMKSVVDGHFRALVAQLLQVENIPSVDENDEESWLEIITSLSWEAATLLKPDMSKSGQMDPGGYVKVKCLASGRRSESMVVKGVVCKKNVAHRRMTSKIEKPRLLILGGALEYHRVSNALSSFDTLLQQEMDHLKMAVAKIEAHRPNILLVEKSVSRYAQEYLLAKNISLVLNIKTPLLERIARCTGSQIVPSIDHLSSTKLGYCDRFHVEKCVEEHGSSCQAGKKLVKTLMYFEGCPKPLGCTILLRGANGDDLKKVKHVVQYGIFAAYHLALETCFLADEGASLPELPVNAPITVALPDKPSKIDRSISTIPGFTVPENEKTPGPHTVGEPQRSMSVPSSELIKLTSPSVPVNEYVKMSDLSAPMSSLYTEPLASFSTEGFQHSSLNGHSPWHASEETVFEDFCGSLEAKSVDAERLTATEDCHVSSDFGDSNVQFLQGDAFNNDANRSVSLPPSFQLNGEQILEDVKEDFQPTPSDHQSILVSLSSRCVWKGTVCERSHLFRIKYYGNFDKPLGRFLRDHLFDQNYRCRSCEMPAEAHVQCYTHRQGTLTISVKKLVEIILPGERDGKIWMWHRCLKCPRDNGFPPATLRVVMSDAAWGLSFGKFLELSFSNHAAASRVASCGHSLHRDCLRFYGFGNMVACFRYASIDVHSVYLPPRQLEFNYEIQEWIQREINEVASRAELLFSEVLNALHLLVERKSRSSMLNSGINVPQSAHHLADLEVMLHEEKREFEGCLQNIVNKEPKKGQPVIDILELNRLRRQLVFRSYVWDHRFIYADSLDDKELQDDMEVSSPESIQKTLAVTDDLLDVANPLEADKSIGDSGSVAANSKTTKSHKHGLSDQQSNHLALALHQRTNSFYDSDPAGAKTTDESDTVESDLTLRRSLSDGQVPFSLSETLDAAWTGENHLGVGITTNNNSSEIHDATKSPTVVLSEKLDQEDHVEDRSLSRQSSHWFSKSSNNTEEHVSWLGMPFMSFYRSLNKNFLGNSQKLDTLSDYDPVYISSFRESELQSGARLLLPVGVNDTVVPVYDDEPTSIISYVLLSDDYLNQLSDEPERHRDATDSLYPTQSIDSLNLPSGHTLDEMILESSRSVGPGDEAFLSFTTSRSSLPLSLDPLSCTKALHARVSFGVDGPLGRVKYTVTCYFAKRFDALRRMCCPSEVDFVRSLSRCKKWGAQGGKSNVFFAKTLDDRFIVKQVTKTELESFIKFAPGYFNYVCESIGTGSPTCLAKILGIYQVASRHQKGGKDSKMDFLVMENLLFGRNLSRLYDLKGSSRSRYNSDTTGSNKVLLDQNLIEAMPTSPIFVGNKAKRVLERAVWNDTAFLASVDVMDYSLLVGVDEGKNELVLGIIDFMRQYTWDKHLETWVKASGILGGPKNASPTVISPKQYKRRFRKAMTTYFLMVPDQWSPPATGPSKSQADLSEDNYSQTTTTPAE